MRSSIHTPSSRDPPLVSPPHSSVVRLLQLPRLRRHLLDHFLPLFSPSSHGMPHGQFDPVLTIPHVSSPAPPAAVADPPSIPALPSPVRLCTLGLLLTCSQSAIAGRWLARSLPPRP